MLREVREEHLTELESLGFTKRFGKQVCHVGVCRNILQVDQTLFHTLADGVEPDADVPHLGRRPLSDARRWLIIAVQ